MPSLELFMKLLLVTFVILDVSADDITPCRIADDVCITNSAKAALPLILAGNPALGVNTSDPLYLNMIDGKLSILSYVFTDATFTGFKNCDVNNVKLDMEKMNLQLNLTCTNLRVEGHYVISGRLIVLPVEGNGTFTILCKKYQLGMDSEIKNVKGKDDKNHLQIKKFTLTHLEAQEGITYDFKNLFNGQKDLADAVLKFANENWKEVADFVQAPVFNKGINKAISNVNKYLKTIPVENLFVM